jgi:hypothetical protein
MPVTTDPAGSHVEALLPLRAGELALIDAGSGRVRVEVAASTRALLAHGRPPGRSRARPNRI